MFDHPPSPLPQGEVGKAVVNTQIVNGFWQFLPAKATTFFSRVYFRNFPRPLFLGGLPPYPVAVPIVKLEVPSNQAFIIKNIEFNVYEKTPIGNDEYVAVSPSRVVTYFGFEILIGNRSPYDFSTNLTAGGDPIDYKPTQAGATTVPPFAGQGTNYPFSGPNQPLGENFAAYATSGEGITLVARVLREPPFDARLLTASLAGYNLNQRVLQDILGRITA
jgi:hypothetical protein